MLFVDADIQQNGWGITESTGGVCQVAEPQSLLACRSAMQQSNQSVYWSWRWWFTLSWAEVVAK